jgi:predicted transcriptional regulator
MVRRMQPADDTPYTVAEVAALTGFSRQTITRIFENEPGVLVVERPGESHKRGYRSIRIPRTVYERVVREMRVKEPGSRYFSGWRRYRQ